VCYDIASPRRLRRVHAFLKKHGLPVQYSVFLVEADRSGLDALLDGLRERIHPKRDDVRAYGLPRRLWYKSLGAPSLPRGLLLALGGEQGGHGSLEIVERE
jgi:CRISPR-associated protein Cas2